MFFCVLVRGLGFFLGILFHFFILVRILGMYFLFFLIYDFIIYL